MCIRDRGSPIKALIARKGPDSSVTWVEPKELARRLEPEEEADPAGEVQELSLIHISARDMVLPAGGAAISI